MRNAIGNDLLPTLTELAKEGEQFFAANKVEIAKDLTEAIRGVGVGLKDLTADMPRIEHFFDRMAKVWHYLNMTPGELVTAAMGGRDSPFYKPHLGMSELRLLRDAGWRCACGLSHRARPVRQLSEDGRHPDWSGGSHQGSARSRARCRTRRNPGRQH